MLAPLRMMAPVGSEVILVSGLFGERNEFVPRESIEWTLTPDSVGHIVAAGEENDCLKQILHRPANKRNASYAVTRASSAAKILTRGTPKPTDDVSILRGQSWVTVTSPSEGATHVSVLAPDAENWDQRRKTATIHWVDVQWTLPGPAVVQAADPHTLKTVVTRSSGKPLPGWIVRYEVSKTSGISFGPEGQDGIEVKTDENGEASINLMPPNKSSSAQFLIKIIRPSKPDDDLPRMVVGQGWASVSWSAPDPKVTVYGPESAAIGSMVTYRAEISNVGDITSRQTVASTSIPSNMKYVKSDPPAKVVGNDLFWELGDLAPQDKRSISVTCRPERNGSSRFSVRVESADQIQGQRLAAEASVNTHVFTSALSLKLTGPETANVGDTVTFEIEYGNTGFETLKGIVIRDQLPAGLAHPTLRERVIQWPLGDLAAGASRKVAVKLIVRQTGRLCHTVDATADGGHSASATACLEARDPPKPNLHVTINGPDLRRVGQLAKYTIRATNTGEATLTNVRILSTYDASLFPKNATPGYDAGALKTQREFRWPIDRLPRGETASFGVEFECLSEAAAAWCRVSVEAAEGVRKVADAHTKILPRQQIPVVPPEPAPEIPEPGPPKPKDEVTGTLKVSIRDLTDPVAAGTENTYMVVIENGRNVADRNVELTLHLQEGMEFVKLQRGPVAARNLSPDRRTVEFTPIAELRAGETLNQNPFYIQVKCVKVGKYTVKVSVDSLQTPPGQPVEAQVDTTVTKSG